MYTRFSFLSSTHSPNICQTHILCIILNREHKLWIWILTLKFTKYLRIFPSSSIKPDNNVWLDIDWEIKWDVVWKHLDGGKTSFPLLHDHRKKDIHWCNNPNISLPFTHSLLPKGGRANYLTAEFGERNCRVQPTFLFPL